MSPDNPQTGILAKSASKTAMGRCASPGHVARRGLGRCFLVAILVITSGAFGNGPVAGNIVQDSDIVQSPLFSVGVSIPPQAYFIDKITDGIVDVVVMIEQGADPHNYSPTPSSVLALSNALVYFGSGLETEEHLKPKFIAGNPDLEWVHTTTGNAGHHPWLSITEVRHSLKIMLETLSRLAPEHEEQFRAGTAQFVLELDQLESDLQEIFKKNNPDESWTFVSDHSAWENLSEEFNLNMIVIYEDGKSPSVRHLAGIIDKARSMGLRKIIADLGHRNREAQVVAESVGAKVIELNPIATDWINNMRAAASAIKEASR